MVNSTVTRAQLNFKFLLLLLLFATLRSLLSTRKQCVFPFSVGQPLSLFPCGFHSKDAFVLFICSVQLPLTPLFFFQDQIIG